MNFLTLIPKQLWGVLAGLLIGAFIVFTAYDKGVEVERTKWKLKVEEEINKEVSQKLEVVNKSLEDVLKFKDQKDATINRLNDRLDASEGQSKDLQELLDEVLNNPNTTCPLTPDDEYRLYESLLNQRRPD